PSSADTSGPTGDRPALPPVRPGRTLAVGLLLVALLTCLTLVSNLLYRRYLTAASLPNGAVFMFVLCLAANALLRRPRPRAALNSLLLEPPVRAPLDPRGARLLPPHGAASRAARGRRRAQPVLARSARLDRLRHPRGDDRDDAAPHLLSELAGARAAGPRHV